MRPKSAASRSDEGTVHLRLCTGSVGPSEAASVTSWPPAGARRLVTKRAMEVRLNARLRRCDSGGGPNTRQRPLGRRLCCRRSLRAVSLTPLGRSSDEMHAGARGQNCGLRDFAALPSALGSHLEVSGARNR